MKFSIKDFFRKCDQIRRKLFIYLFIYHSIKKNENKVATLAAMGHGYL